MPPEIATSPLVILGAGGHAKVVLELIQASLPHVRPIGFLDADAAPRQVLGLPVLGDDGRLSQLRAEGVGHAFVALGDNRLRQRLAVHLEALGFELPSAVSPRAYVSPSAHIDRGAAVLQGAAVNAQAEIGAFAIVNTAAVVEHDCRIGQAAHVAPGAVMGGGAELGDRGLVGLGARVLPGVRLGADVTLGAGACAVSDLPVGVTAIGIPAKVIGDTAT